MDNVAGFERVPFATLDRSPANLIGGGGLAVENLAADDDSRVAGLDDKQVRLLLMQLRAAAARFAACFQEQVISPGPQGLARKPVFHRFVKRLFACAKLFRGPMLVA